MAKKTPLVDGDQLLLDLRELRERQRQLEKLRDKESAIRSEYNAVEMKRKDLKRQLLEIGWDIRKLCCLVTNRMGRLLDRADEEGKDGAS